MATAAKRQTRKPAERRSARRITAHSYTAGGKTLIVPPLAAWLLHEAATPDASLRATARAAEQLRQQKQRDDLRRLRRKQYRDDKLLDALGLAWSHVGLTYDNARNVAEKFSFDWWSGFVCRGEDPPAGVTVAAADEILRMAAATDYVNLARIGDAIEREKTYGDWFRDGKLPSGKPTAHGMFWLWGLVGVVEGMHIISEPEARLRSCRTIDGRITGAGISKATFFRAKDRHNEVMIAALEGAAANGGIIPKGIDGWNKLDASMQRSIAAIAKASTVAESCKRANTGTTTYWRNLADAKAKGCEEELRRYLDGELTAADGADLRKSGMITPTLYLPPRSMPAFRKLASRAIAAFRISYLRDEYNQAGLLPCFDQWFLDWTNPLRDPAAAPAGDNGQQSGDAAQDRKSRCFPKGLKWLDDRQYEEFVYHLDGHRGELDENGEPLKDNAIARHYTGESLKHWPEAKRLLSWYRINRKRGKIGI